MLSIKVSIKPDIDKAMRRFPDTMMNHLSRGIQRAAEEVAREEKHVAPKAFSALVNSIKTTRESDISYRVGPTVLHAESIEFGTDPGTFPNIQHIQDWIRVKHIEPESPDADDRTLAFFIARGIYKHGIRPQPFAAPTADKMAPRVHEIVNRAAMSGLREVGL